MSELGAGSAASWSIGWGRGVAEGTAEVISEHKLNRDTLIKMHGEQKARLYAEANEAALSIPAKFLLGALLTPFSDSFRRRIYYEPRMFGFLGRSS